MRLIAYKEGHHVSGLSLLMVKDAPHLNAAKLLANWLVGKEGQEAFAKAKGVMPIRSDVPDFTATEMRVAAKIIGTRTLDDDIEVDRLMKEQFAAGLLGRKR